MKLDKQILIFILMTLLSFILCLGTTTISYNLVSPADGSTLSSRQVNHSINFSLTGTDLPSANVTLWINGSAVSTTYNLTNNTQHDVLYNSTNGDYSWYFNLTNHTNGEYLGKTTTRTYTVTETVPSLSVNLLSPNAYYTSSSTTINFTWNVTGSGGYMGGDENIQCGLWNKSSSSGTYSLTNYTNVTNSTSEISFSMTKVEARHWWYINCSTTYHPVLSTKKSDVRIFDIDTDYYLLTIGTAELIKFYLDTGIMALGSSTTPANMTLYSTNGSSFNCGVNNTGSFICS